MADLCLVTYCLPHEFDRDKVDENYFRRMVLDVPPLGILALAASVRQARMSVELFNLNECYFEYIRLSPGQAFPEMVARKLAAQDASVYGLSTICSSFPLTLSIAGILRRLRPQTPIILGGPQASAVAEEVLQAFPEVDFVLRGEADLTLPQLLCAIRTEDALGLSSIPGLVYRFDDGKVRTATPPQPVEKLDALPVPAYDLWTTTEKRMLAIEVGRGCPFHCSFCSTSGFFGRQNRLKSLDRLVEEITFLTKTYETKNLSFVHDMIAVNRGWVLELAKRLQNSQDGPYEWTCASRADCVDEALLTEMVRAGCRGIFFGIESGSPRMQKLMGKNLQVDRVPSLAKTCNDLQISGTFSFITGFPEERESDIRATANMMMELYRHPSQKVQLTSLAPLSGSDLCDRHRHSLVFDYAISNISFQNLGLDEETVTMVQAYPQLFPDYYGIPMVHVDRSTIFEFQNLCSYLLPIFRWPCVALHQLGVPLYDLFTRWLQHRGALNIRPDRWRSQYLAMETRQNFRNFVWRVTAEHVPQALDAMETLLAAEIYEEQHFEQLKQDFRPRGIEDVNEVPSLMPNVIYRDCPCEFTSIIKSLHASKGFDLAHRCPSGILFSCRNDSIRREQVSPLTRALILACNGERSAVNISQMVAGKFPDVPIQEHVLFALGKLGENGVLTFNEV